MYVCNTPIYSLDPRFSNLWGLLSSHVTDGVQFGPSSLGSGGSYYIMHGTELRVVVADSDSGQMEVPFSLIITSQE